MPHRLEKNSRPWLLLIWLPLVATILALALGAPWGVVAAVAVGAGVVCTLVLLRFVLGPQVLARGRLTRQAANLAWRYAPGQTPRPGAEVDEVAAALSAVRDEVHQRIAELDRQMGNMRRVLDASPWPMFATNAGGEVVISNRAAAEFFQRPQGLDGRAIEDLVTQREVLTLHGAALAGRDAEGQVRIQRSDGTRIYEVRTAPVRLTVGGEQTGAIVSLRDITELATALQLKTDFVANASHELRTPLSSIKVAIETLSDGAWEDESMRARLTGMISSNVARLEEMVRDLLDLSRLETTETPVNLQSVSLGELTAGLAEDFAPIVRERNITLDFEIDPRVERLRTDPKLLTLILKNLIDNAAKFAYEGTKVRIRASPLETDSGGVRVQVADQGVGIPIAQQQRVFERFFQVDPARTGFAHRRGTGLGLAIVKHAVKALGGSIGVESVWKQGTTMTVDLPACVEAHEGGSVTGA
jgi:two-component system phosphate regulon sensor histidine kinase PhoR